MKDHLGRVWRLPALTAWRLEYTSGVPCDSFWLKCPWEPEGEPDPADWVSFTAEENGERVFTGVVDECRYSQSGKGAVLEVSGRSMAARLLDNEALGQDYGTATLNDILRNHVTPYGIEVAPGAKLPAVACFSVATGSSEWSVVYDFARYHGGVAPRFDRMGRLVLTGWPGGKEKIIGDQNPVTELRCRDRRYGVLSQVLVRDRYSGAVERVNNERFRARGGQARRVLTMPGRSNYRAMRYSGQFQLDKSAAQQTCIEVTVAQPFCAWPGELVRVERSRWPKNGLYRAAEVIVGMDEKGAWSRLVLAEPDFVV